LDGRVVTRFPIKGPKDDVDVGLIEEGLLDMGQHDIYDCVREGRVESVAHMVAGFSICDHSGLIDSGRVIASILIIRGGVRRR
jgi:hypothetical protein